MNINYFRVKHAYDIGDQSIYFHINDTKENVTDLAVYIQFKAECMYGDTISLENVTIVRCLTLFGAQILSVKPNGRLNTIDMYHDRQARCGEWYANNYQRMDERYNHTLAEFLKNEAKENKLMGCLETQ